MQPLADQVMIITGASAGVGRALALRCAAAGARLALAARTPGALEEAAAAAAAAAGATDRVIALPTDVRDATAVSRLVEAAVAAFGRIDVLINNAAINVRGPVAGLAETTWDDILGINLKGPFLCSRAVLPHMFARGSGQILFVSSHMALRGHADSAAYCASKAGLNLFAESLREEVRSQGIRVMVFSPGLIRTDFAGSPAAKKSHGMSPESVAAVLLQQITAPADTLSEFVLVRPAPARPQPEADTMTIRLEVYLPFREQRIYKADEAVPAGISPVALLRRLGLATEGDLSVVVNGRHSPDDAPIPPGAEVAVLRRSEGGAG